MTIRDFDPEEFDRIVIEFCYKLILRSYANHLLELAKAPSCLEQ